MDITDIVDKIRHQSEWVNFCGMSEMHQPLYLDQCRLIESLLDAGVHIDVVAKVGFLIEDEDESGRFEHESVSCKTSIFDQKDIFNNLKENKTIIFYFWAILPSFEHKLRYAKSSKIIRPLQRYRKEIMNPDINPTNPTLRKE
jgi:hypothetical protein